MPNKWLKAALDFKLPDRWEVIKNVRDQGVMSTSTVRHRPSKYGARAVMNNRYRHERTVYSLNWRLVRTLKQADRCELTFKKANGKLVRIEYFIQRAGA